MVTLFCGVITRKRTTLRIEIRYITLVGFFAVTFFPHLPGIQAIAAGLLVLLIFVSQGSCRKKVLNKLKKILKNIKKESEVNICQKKYWKMYTARFNTYSWILLWTPLNLVWTCNCWQICNFTLLWLYKTKFISHHSLMIYHEINCKKVPLYSIEKRAESKYFK